MDRILWITLSFLFGCISFVSIVFNSLCLYALRRSKDPNDIKIIFLKSLTTSDLLNGLFLALPIAIVTGTTNLFLGGIMCAVLNITAILCISTGLYSLLAVSFDRFIAITWPLRYTTLVTRRRARIIVIIIWIIFIANLVSKTINTVSSPSAVATRECTSINFTSQGHIVAASIGSLATYLTPLIIVVVIYTKIYLIARRHARFVASQRPNSLPDLKNKTPLLKSAKSLFIITAMYLLAWAPQIIKSIYFFYL